nr:zinc finger, CCHC-type [Tanacetum cinerariifolium]
MDVKTAFLNVGLDEEVYMNQPRGFIKLGNVNKVDAILGIRIKHESNGIEISQSYYIKEVLKNFNYFDCTPVSSPMDTSEKLMPNNGQDVSQLESSRVIGFLMYAMTCIRPDIALSMGKLSRYTSNPSTQQWQAIQRVLKYLNKSMDYSLVYIGYPSLLEGYTNASWISNTEDNLSTSGGVFLLGGGPIHEMERPHVQRCRHTWSSRFYWRASALEEIRVEFKTKIWDLLVESDAPEDKLDFPVLQACAKDMPQLLNELLDVIINGVLAPTARVKKPFQMLVSMIHKGDNWGRFMTGKITVGVLARNEKVKALCPGVVKEGKVLRIRKTIRLETMEIDKGYVGDIISVAVGGLENMQPGETLAGIEVLSIN